MGYIKNVNLDYEMINIKQKHVISTVTSAADGLCSPWIFPTQLPLYEVAKHPILYGKVCISKDRPVVPMISEQLNIPYLKNISHIRVFFLNQQ